MKPLLRTLILITLPVTISILGCGPEEREPQQEDQNQNPDKIEDASEFANCLLTGGELFITDTHERDSVGINSLAIAADGSIAIGDSNSAVHLAPQALDFDSMEILMSDIMDLLIPASADQGITSLAFSDDGSTLISGEDNGRISVFSRSEETSSWDNRPSFWDFVSEEPIRAVTASTDGSTVGWLDASFTGQPRLWDEAVLGGTPPEPLQTQLWQGYATGWLRDGALWMIAGDWYGLPLIEIRNTADPSATVENWLLGGEDFEGAPATVTAIVPNLDETHLLIAGHRNFEDDGFIALAEIIEIDETSQVDSLQNPGLPTIHFLQLEDHRPNQAHLLAGGRVALTLGERGDITVWDLEDLTALTTATFHSLMNTAIDPNGRVLLGVTQAGEILQFSCKE